MKKQYTLENFDIYGNYIKVVLHSNNKKSKIFSSAELNNYIKSLEKNGQTRGYTKRDLKEAKERIESFERSIIY